jgi:HEPN domain-containing protein
VTDAGRGALLAEWLEAARRDWHRVKRRVDEGDTEDAAFHLQQALEKFLKGFLIGRGWELRRIHTLPALLDEAAHHHAGLDSFRDVCERVSEYYLLERYPPLIRPSDRDQLLKDVQDARTLILNLFPDEQLD